MCYEDKPANAVRALFTIAHRFAGAQAVKVCGVGVGGICMYGIYILATQFLCAMASIIPWTMGFYVFLLRIDKIFHKKINWLKKSVLLSYAYFYFGNFITVGSYLTALFLVNANKLCS